MHRRDALKLVGVGGLTTVAPAVTATGDSAARVGNSADILDTEPVQAARTALSEQGWRLQVEQTRAANVDNPVYEIPISSGEEGTESSDDIAYASVHDDGVRVTGQVDRTYFTATPETVRRSSTEVLGFKTAESVQGVEARLQGNGQGISTQSHADDVLFAWNYGGTYDVEDLCQVLEPTGALAGAYSLLEGISLSTLSKLKSIFFKVTIGGAAACYTEDIAEQLSQVIHDCPKDKYLYEVYNPKWWAVGFPPVIVAKCP